jgi:hypothetical protein
MGPMALLLLQGKHDADFYPPWNSISSAGFDLVNLGSNGKYTIHYTTKVTNIQT